MGGAGEVQKKNSRKGKLNEKNSCKPINPKKYSCYGLKKIRARNLITKKNSSGSKIPLPTHNFSNGPSLKSSHVCEKRSNHLESKTVATSRTSQSLHQCNAREYLMHENRLMARSREQIYLWLYAKAKFLKHLSRDLGHGFKKTSPET